MTLMPIDRSEWQRDERGQGRHAEEEQSRHVMAHGTNLANEVLCLQPQDDDLVCGAQHARVVDFGTAAHS
jgi:hypothetical protein